MQSALYTIMLNAAQKAARGIQRDYGEVSELQVSRKGTMDFVTQTDIRAEKIIQDDLAHARPKFGFLMEEAGEIEGTDKEHRWVIDPIDGTTNFIHAVPYFCIAISLEKRRANGQWYPIAALVYDPMRDEAFYAEENKGAFLNNRRLAVSGRQKLDEALLVTHSPKHDREHFRESLGMITTVTEFSKGARTMGSTALDLAYIAAGRFDAGWYTAFKRWDVSAGILLVKEAKATVTQVDGDDNVDDPQSLLVGAPKIHSALSKLLKPVWQKRSAA